MKKDPVVLDQFLSLEHWSVMICKIQNDFCAVILYKGQELLREVGPSSSRAFDKLGLQVTFRNRELLKKAKEKD